MTRAAKWALEIPRWKRRREMAREERIYQSNGFNMPEPPRVKLALARANALSDLLKGARPR